MLTINSDGNIKIETNDLINRDTFTSPITWPPAPWLPDENWNIPSVTYKSYTPSLRTIKIKEKLFIYYWENNGILIAEVKENQMLIFEYINDLLEFLKKYSLM